MRVLQVVTTESPFFETQVDALEARGVDCTVVSLPRSPDSSRSPREYAAFYRRVLSTAARDVDLVHANYGLVGPVALAQPRRPVVLTLWGSDVMGAAGWLDAVSGWAARLSDAVVVPSRAMSPHLDCPHHVVPFGVDTDAFRPIPRDEARAELGWDADETVVLFPYPEHRAVKNYPLAERVVDAVPGDPVLKTMSEIPHDEVPLHMNASDAVLLTSRRESGPMVVREAAACNVPVVATDVGFVRETLDGVAGSAVCEAESELVSGLDAALAAERSDGRERVESLTPDAMADRLLAVYRAALSGSRGVSGARA